MTTTVTALYRYPIKGCAGLDVSELTLDARGPEGDRRMMIVDDRGHFLTQRQLPTMALIQVLPRATGWRLQAPRVSPCEFDGASRVGPARSVQVWNDVVSAYAVSAEVDRWLSQVLQREVCLVRMDDNATRLANPRYAAPDTQVSFADGYPLLVIGQASLDHLNAQLREPLPMNRFRPNVVISGAAPHAEDSWASIVIGAVTLDVVKPCDRCVVTTVDQATGVAGKEPLRTLAAYRQHEHKIYFGQNAVHRSLGALRVGDEVKILDVRTPSPALLPALER